MLAGANNKMSVSASIQVTELQEEVKIIKEQLETVSKRSSFEWEQPAALELSVKREDYRNIFGYSEQWVQEHDLFGLNRFLPKEFQLVGTP